MWHLTTADGSRAVRRVSNRRRRFATCLLLGWVMLSFVTVVQAYCGYSSGPQVNAGQEMAHEIGSDAMWSANRHCGAPFGEASCQDASAASVVPSNTANAGASRFELPSPIALAASAAPSPLNVGLIRTRALSAPPLSGAPAYLRHQRLLI
jgi:hypothetical protein